MLYILSSFLALNWFLQAVTCTLYYNASLPFPTEDEGVPFPIEMVAILCFCGTSICLFFLYPCICAAAITESREILIYKINKESLLLPIVTPKLKDQLILYLRNQNFGFKLELICAKVSFGLNVAYLSILISLFGVLLKVTSTI